MLDTAYNRDGINETILITRSNKRASDFNLAIRGNILYRETELTAGELLLVSKNNYYWSSKVKGLDFIANGDVVEVVKVFGMEAKYGYYFADVMLAMPDRDVEFEAKIFMETLSNDTPGLTAERTAELYTRLMKELNGDLKALKQNPYFNALQMKYAYAVTCHKAQGGQWQNVFVDMSYISPDAYGMEFYRWLYTAVSRARSNLYFINPGMEAE
jgi:exodeoxyribonuclease-5